MADEPDDLSYIRYGQTKDDYSVVALNFVPVTKDHFRVPVHSLGTYTILLNTENLDFGGTWTQWQATLTARSGELYGEPAWLDVILPDMGALSIVPQKLQPLQ